LKIVRNEGRRGLADYLAAIMTVDDLFYRVLGKKVESEVHSREAV